MYLDSNNVHVMSKYLPLNGFKWIDLKDFDSNKYSRNSSKRCVLETDLENSKELLDLYSDYPLTLDKI